MANEYVITIRNVVEMNAAAGAAAAGVASPFANLEKSAEQSARRVEKSFAGSGPRIYKSLDAGREAWVKDQVTSSEKATKGIIGNLISSANERVRNEERASATERRNRDRALREAERDIARMQRERERIVASSDRAVERAEEQSYARRIRNAQRFAREQANAFLNQLGPGGGAGGAGGAGGGGAGGGIGAALGGGMLGGFLGGAVALIGHEAIAGIRQGAEAWVEYASRLQNARIAFTAMLGSAQAAETHLKELQQFALETPFQFADLVDASQRMQALGFRAKEIVPILKDVGNAVAAAGGGAERLERVIKALSDVRAKEKLQTQEIRQFAEAGISVYKILQEETGKSVAEIQKLVEAGQISSDLFLRAFQKFSQVHFGDMMEKQARTFTGAMSNIQDVLLQTAGKAFQPLFDRIGEIAYRTQQELQKTADLEGVADVMAKGFTELGAMMAVKFAEGLGAALAKPKTYELIVKYGGMNWTGEIAKGIGKELAGQKFQAEVERELENLRSGKGMTDLGWFSGESKTYQTKVQLVAINRDIADTTTRLIDLLKKESDAAEDNSSAWNANKAAREAVLAVKLKDADWEKVPENLVEQRKAILKALQDDYTALRQQYGRFTPGDLMEKVVLARADTLLKFKKQIEETNIKLGRRTTPEDFGELAQYIQRAEQMEKSVKAVEDSARKAEENRQQRMRDIASASETLETRLGEVTERTRQLNAEVGKAPNALEDFNLWFEKLDDKTKSLIQSTPKLSEKLEALRTASESFSQTQAKSGIVDFLDKVNREIDRYGDDGRKGAVLASVRLQAEFDKSGLAARGLAEDVAKVTAAIAELQQKEKEADAEREQRRQNQLRRSLDDLTMSTTRRSMREDSNLGRLTQSFLGNNDLFPAGGGRAFEPLLNFVKQVTANPDALASSTKALIDMRNAFGLKTDPFIQSNVEELRLFFRDILANAGLPDAAKRAREMMEAFLEAGKADTPAGRAAARTRDEIERLKETLVSTQGEVAIAAETAALRYDIAWQRAINDVVLADDDARISMIESQVKIADQTVFHTDRARAAVLDHMASMRGVTDIFADAFTKMIDVTGGALDKVLDKITRRLGAFGDVIKQVLSDIGKLAISRVFRPLLDALLPPTGPGGTPTFTGGPAWFTGGSGGGRSGGVSSLLPALLRSFTGGGTGAGGNTVAAGILSGAIPDLATAGASSPGLPSWTAQQMQQQVLMEAASGSGSRAAARSATGIFGGMNLGALKTSFAGILPMLGLSLGAGLGGNSMLGSVLGGAGGLLAGGIGTALLAPSIFGIGTAGGSSALMAGMYGLLTNPFTAVAAGALIVGALLLRRNAAKQKNEKDRAALNNDTYTAVIEILNNARGGKYSTAAAALADFDKVKANYFQRIAGYDSKTKRIATEVWNDRRNGFEYYRTLIEQAANDASKASEFESKFVPTYDVGGSSGRFAGLPGVYNSARERLSWVRDDETVLTPAHVARLGGNAVMAAAGVPGYGSAGIAAAATVAAAQSGVSVQNAAIRQPVVIVVFSQNEARALMAQIPHAQIAEKFEENIAAPGSDLLNNIATRLSRGF